MTIFRLLARSGYVKAGVLGVALLALFAVEGWSANLDASQWANWVQAVGSIVALAVAIFVMSRQNRNAAKLIADADRLATLRRANSVRALVLRAYAQMRNIRGKTEIRRAGQADIQDIELHLKVSIQVMEEMLTYLKTIPTYDLGSFEMAAGVHRIIDAAGSFLITLNALKIHPAEAGMPHVVDGNAAIFGIVREGVEQFEKGKNELE